MKKIISKTEDAGIIAIPVKRQENVLILRTHLATATEPNGKKWGLSHSGGCIVIDVPTEKGSMCFSSYTLTFEDIITAIMKKEESRDKIKTVIVKDGEEIKELQGNR